MTEANSLPYQEPNIVTILIQSSFLFLLNLLNSILDRTLYCGLVGQVLLGVAWGTPGPKWLPDTAERTIVQLGYLGLILLVYEGKLQCLFLWEELCHLQSVTLLNILVGGLSTSFSRLKANLLLSIFVALTGISFPIAFSFILKPLANATSLQSFAAGAALCSTSLGTTLTVINTSGLSNTRLGVVLTSAAMMDDVVGLVMVQIVSNLGSKGHSITPASIIRPLLVSLAFTIILPVLCRFVVEPCTKALNRARQARAGGKTDRVLSRSETALLIHTALLTALVAGASYAGTSNLFAAYLAGVVISWWDSEVPHLKPTQEGSAMPTKESSTSGDHAGQLLDPSARPRQQPSESCRDSPSATRPLSSGAAIYEHYHQQAVQRVLKPFFFASVGFSIPISRMFSGKVVWRGIIYSILMAIGKLICGAWLIRISFRVSQYSKVFRVFKAATSLKLWQCQGTNQVRSASKTQQDSRGNEVKGVLKPQDREQPPSSNPATSSAIPITGDDTQKPEEQHNQTISKSPQKPVSLYPSAILGSAMVARGEIGFLISSLAQSKGIFNSSSPEPSSEADADLFLMITWAIMLCTLVGPLCVGALVRRVKRLEKDSSSRNEHVEQRRDVLGVWGVG